MHIIYASGDNYGHYGNSPVITQVVFINKSVTLRGGYTTAFTEPPDPESNLTALDAQRQGRVLLLTGDISATVEGLRITGGDAEGLGGFLEPWDEIPGDAGGGIYVSGAAATLRNNWVISNTADGGGGMYLGWNDSIVVQSNIISANTADYGGGLLLDFSDATVEDNKIIHNNAIEGGGLYLFVSHATLDTNTITANNAGEGGGLNLQDSNTTVSGNTISTVTVQVQIS